MAGPRKKASSWDRHDEQRLRSAVMEISRSDNLRYFIRSLLGNCGINDVFPADNALLMARAAGKHEIGLSVLATLQMYQPRLWPTLLMEEQNELAERTEVPIAAERPDRGDADPDDAAGDSAYE